MRNMARRVQFDPEADVLYILLREGPAEDAVEAGEDVYIELGAKGEIIGMEIRGASNVLESVAQAIAAEARRELTRRA